MATKTVYDYCIFFEDGHKEAFHLDYGPTERKDRIIGDWRTDPYIKRFHDEAPADVDVYGVLEFLDEEHSIGFILVNPPREMEV